MNNNTIHFAGGDKAFIKAYVWTMIYNIFLTKNCWNITFGT